LGLCTRLGCGDADLKDLELSLAKVMQEFQSLVSFCEKGEN